MKKSVVNYLILALLLFGCAKENSSNPGISFSVSEKTIYEDDLDTLKFNGTPSGTYKWVSQDSKIATVNNGVVKGVSDGTTIITISDVSNPTLTSQCTISVLPRGSKEKPYEIKTVQDLITFRNRINTNSSKYGGRLFVLMNDLDLSGLSSWIPIGTFFNSISPNPFNGIFNGNGKIIKNIRIGLSSTAENIIGGGLFGFVDHGVIMNLGVQWININTAYKQTEGNNSFAGGIAAALNTNGIIVNCFSVAPINLTCSQSYAGGIVGRLNGGYISNCYAAGQIYVISSSALSYASGIAGFSDAGSIDNCIALQSQLTSRYTYVNTNNPARIVDWQNYNNGSGNYASSSMVVKQQTFTGAATIVTNFSDEERHGLNLTANAVDLLNNYVSINREKNGIALSAWRVQSGVNNGYPVFK